MSCKGRDLIKTNFTLREAKVQWAQALILVLWALQINPSLDQGVSAEDKNLKVSELLLLAQVFPSTPKEQFFPGLQDNLKIYLIDQA